MKCRHCHTELKYEFVDLYESPPSNSYLSDEDLEKKEEYYPLKIMVCDKCFLVQVDEHKNATEIFDENYAYFSSYSTSWLKHSKNYVDYMIDRFEYNNSSLIVEIASNDGYLLQYFKEQNVPVLGVEPTHSTAVVAIKKGIDTIEEFFGEGFGKKLAAERRKANLILGNNVLAHVPDINDFVKGMKALLADDGVVTMEFPHLYQLVKNNQFDTIYHEHFSYLSFTTVKTIFESAGLEMFDVQEITTHGGSLRIFAKHNEDATKDISTNVSSLLEKEQNAGITTMEYYKHFQPVVDNIKEQVLSFLNEQKVNGKKVIGYGAAAKGNTLLNFCKVKAEDDFIDFVVDASPHKQEKYLPGSHIPIVNEDMIKTEKPEFIIILPWNIKDEITEQLSYIRDWGGKFVTAIPKLEIF